MLTLLAPELLVVGNAEGSSDELWSNILEPLPNAIAAEEGFFGVRELITALALPRVEIKLTDCEITSGRSITFQRYDLPSI